MSILAIVGIMVAAGIIGGTVNVALGRPASFVPREWLWSVAAGVGAALLIPLFMSIVSSDLLTNMSDGDPSRHANEILIFAGFCLLAAISSKVFIQTITDEVLQKVTKSGQDAKDAKERTERTARDSMAVSMSAMLGVSQKPAEEGLKGLPPMDISPGSVPDDPWAGQFCGKDAANNRRLEAEIALIDELPGWCSITLRVRSTNQETHPLSGEVRFYLHDSFTNNKPVVPVRADGVAEITIAAWGAFTVGAMADGGNTLLELDLSKHPRAPEPFRSR
jgi:hypothetical protein